MIIPTFSLGRILFPRFYAVAEGFTWQPIVCERCRIEWAFRVQVSGLGSSVSPLELDNLGAEARAKAQALAAASEHGRSVVDVGTLRNIPCPACGWYQAAMVERMRAEHGAPWLGVSAVSLVVGLLLVVRGVTDGEHMVWDKQWILSGLMSFACSIASVVWRKRLQDRYEPNTALSRNVTSSPYRISEEAINPPTHVGQESLEVVTYQQYERMRLELEAQGLAPLFAIKWRRSGDIKAPAPVLQPLSVEEVRVSRD